MTMRLAILVALVAGACGETVRVPLDLETSDRSCQGDGFQGECAASILVELVRPGEAPDRECIELSSGLESLEDLRAQISGVRFPSLSEGDTVTVTVSIFDESGCTGAAFVSGTSEPKALGQDLASIPIELGCEAPAVCGGEGDAFSAIVREIIGDGDEIESLNVTVGYSNTSYAQRSSLTFAGGERFTGELSAGSGCVSVGAGDPFEGLPFVSCETATGSIGADHFAFAASNEALQNDFGNAGLAVARTVLGRVESDGGAPVAGAIVSVAGDGDGEFNILYYGEQGFVANEATFGNGIFAIGAFGASEPAGCCQTITASSGEINGQTTVHILDGAVAAARIIIAD